MNLSPPSSPDRVDGSRSINGTAVPSAGRRAVRPLRILLISPSRPDITGADRDWLNLANAWDAGQVQITWVGVEGSERLRHHVTTDAVSDFVDLGAPPFFYVIQENAERRRSPWLWTKILADHALRLWGPWRRAQRLRAGSRYDLVVSNTAAVTLGAVLAWSWKLPHLWCVKECLDPTSSACRRWARWIVRSSDAVVVPSRAVARPFPASVHVLPDGSDVARIRWAARQSSRAEVLRSLELPPERPVVAQVGGLCHWKGQHVMAEAFVRLATGGATAGPPASLLFLGQGAPEYRARLESILVSLPPAWREAVRFVHFKPDDFSYLSAADVVVHPSVLPDPFPNAIREAMILGKPVVGARGGGIIDMIRHDETGLLAEPGDAGTLAAAVHDLLSRPERARHLGQNAAHFAGEQFNIQTCQARFLALLRDLARYRPKR